MICAQDLALPVCGSSKQPTLDAPPSAKQIFTDSNGVVSFQISEELSADNDNETLKFPESGHLRDGKTAV